MHIRLYHEIMLEFHDIVCDGLHHGVGLQICLNYARLSKKLDTNVGYNGHLYYTLCKYGIFRGEINEGDRTQLSDLDIDKTHYIL